MFVTFEVSQLSMAWSNECAPENMRCISVTFDTSQLIIFPLKLVLFLNKSLISVIREVFHVFISPYVAVVEVSSAIHALIAVCKSDLLEGIKAILYILNIYYVFQNI